MPGQRWLRSVHSPDVADETSRSAPARPRRADLATPSLPARRFAWVREIILVIGFYNVYQVVRGQADVGARARAFRNARWVVDAERLLHVFVEHALQTAALGARGVVTFANTYYGTVHFVAKIGRAHV